VRLQLTSAVVLGALSLCLCHQVWAQDVEVQDDIEEESDSWTGEVTSRYQLYSDDDKTTVSTGVIDATLQVPLEVQVGAHILLDAVSSASVDVVSAATDRWTETRAEAGVRAARELAGLDLGMSYVRSQEQDWASNSFQVGVGRDFLQRNLRVEANLGLVLNRIGRASDPVFEEKMKTYYGELGVSQLLDAKSRAGVSYGLQRLRGYQASPYRYVEATDGTRMPETHPDLRMRHSVSSYALRELTSWLAGRLNYRYYWDDWGVRSHTGELRLRVDFSDSLFLTWQARVYQQRDAEFYRKGYLEALVYMTNDRELSRFWNIGSSASLGARLGPVLVDAKLGLTHYSFKNFAALPTRRALTAGAGASMPW
jgi:hypothetical protein